VRQLGYTRVSTSSQDAQLHQDAQLQLDALVAAGVQKRDVFADVTSGSKTAIERHPAGLGHSTQHPGITQVGPVSVAQLLITAGETFDRFRNEAAFARLCGVDPSPSHPEDPIACAYIEE
jgi:hypothetical protein